MGRPPTHVQTELEGDYRNKRHSVLCEPHSLLQSNNPGSVTNNRPPQ